MRAEFEILAGPLKGNRLVLDSTKAVKVGRNESTDFPIPGDKRLSGRHFALKLDGENCLIRDLDSRNGTSVNGTKVSGKQTLKSGDLIEAGNSQFRVVLVYNPLSVGAEPGQSKGEAPAATSPDEETPNAMDAPGAGGEEPTKPAAPPPVPPKEGEGANKGLFPRKEAKVEAATPPPIASGVAVSSNGSIPKESPYVLQECDSGATLFQPPKDAPEESIVGPVTLAKRLADECPMYLLVDLTKIGSPIPEKLKEPLFLFDWLPQDALRGNSPLLFAPGGPADLFRLMEKGWGKRGIICLFTRDKPDKVLTHWRKAIRGGPTATTTGVPETFLGICWPQILASVLECSDDRSQAEFLMRGMEAILVEGKPPQTWKIFSGESFSGALDQFGMKQVS